MNQPNYSQIIGPEDYNKIIGQHLYIASADKAIVRLVQHYNESSLMEVVEFGCGPARLLRLLSNVPRICLTGIDHDETFIRYAENVVRVGRCGGSRAKVVLADATTYKHPHKINIAVSQGFHHHMKKGQPTQDYLANIYSQLPQGGIYIVGDEFLPDYNPDYPGQRAARAIIWYSHIIQSAIKQKHLELAVEEAKTLLDDLSEGTVSHTIKSENQIELVLESAWNIDRAARFVNHEDICKVIHTFKDRLAGRQAAASPLGEPSMDLSRGDFKICHRVFAEEVTKAGFTITGIKTVGPIETIGGLAVYVLRKL